MSSTFNAACKNCRIAKAKCIRGLTAEDGKEEKCRRCEGAGWECSLMPRAARKRRKRMHARVSDLEEQLKEIEGLVGRAKKGNMEDGGLGLPDGMLAMDNVSNEETFSTRMFPLTPDSGTSGQSMGREAFSAGHENLIVDEDWMNPDWEVPTLPGIIPDLLPLGDARQLLDKFRTVTVQQFPLILLSENDTFSTLASTKPTLLLAMITAASMSGPGSLFKRLHEELMKRLAMKVIVGGERSVELVQALLVMEVWYCVPHGLDEGVNFYQWIHVAATMALQLGLGKIDWKRMESRDSAMEEARILLAAWLSCSCVAVSLRRENMMKMTPSFQECLDKFEEQAVDINDKRLLAWIKLQMIAEEAQSITPDQKHVQGSCLARSPDIPSQVYCLQRQLETWESGVEPGIMNETLTIHHLYCKAKILEIPLHAYHDLSSLVVYPILCNNDLLEYAYRQIPTTMAPVYMRAAVPYMDACYKLLDTFASMPADALGNCPTVVFVRAVYSMSALGFVVNGPLLRDDVQVQRHVRDLHGRVEKALIAAVGDVGRQVPAAFLEVWRRMGASGQETRIEKLKQLHQPEESFIVSSLDTAQLTDLTSCSASPPLGTGQDAIFSNMDSLEMPSHNCTLMAQGNLEHQTNFLNGFGSADLVF